VTAEKVFGPAAGERSTMANRRRVLSIAAIAAAVLVLLIVALQVDMAWTSRHARDALVGTPFTPEREAPVATLVDQRGASAPLIDPRSSATFIFFGYTHCKEACPLALATLAKAYRKLPSATGVRVEMVTVDPARDDPPALRRFVAQFDPHFIGLTAKKSELQPIWAAFDVLVDAKTNDVVHGEAIYLVDRNRRVVTMYPSDTAPADLAHDANAIAQGGG
jgi:protein SCO1/2